MVNEARFQSVMLKHYQNKPLLDSFSSDGQSNCICPRARGVLFVLKGPYDLRVVKFSQESESARLTKIILSKSTAKTL